MGFYARILVLSALLTAACYRGARPEAGLVRLACPGPAGEPPTLVADFSDWQPLGAPIFAGGAWAFEVTAPPPGLYRLQCRTAAGEGEPPLDFPWLEDDGFGGRNAIWYVPQVTSATETR